MNWKLLEAGRASAAHRNTLLVMVVLSCGVLEKLMCHSDLQKGRELPLRSRPSFSHKSRGLLRCILFEDAALDLVFFYALEEGAEVAFAEAFVAFALDELEEDRADDGFGEDL